MAKVNSNHLIGLLCIIGGIAVIVIALGDLLARVVIALLALTLINYGLRLRGLPPLQLLIPMAMSGKGSWFNQWR